MSAERFTVEVIVHEEGGPTIHITETHPVGVVWQRGFSVSEAESLHRALGFALSETNT